MRRSPTTLIVHLSADAPPFLEGAGPLSPETAERLACDARRLTIKPSAATSCTRASDAAPPTPQLRALTSAQSHCQYPAAPQPANSKHTTSSRTSAAAQTQLDNLILLCPRHHKLLHDHHIRTSGTGEQPTFMDAAGARSPPTNPTAPPR